MRTIRGSILALAALLPVSHATAVVAQPLDEVEKFKIWSVVCAKQNAKPDCAAVAAVHAAGDTDQWAKAAFSSSDKTGQLQLFLRTPRLTYLKTGFSVGFDGKQFGRAAVERCDLKSCEATIDVGPELRELVGTRQKMTVEYAVSESEGVSLAFDLDGVVQALTALRNLTQASADMVASMEQFHSLGASGARTEAAQRLLASTVMLYNVELRQLPGLQGEKKGEASWQTPLKGCGKLPPKKEVRVNADSSIQNAVELSTWLDATTKCKDNTLVWVVPKPGQAEGLGQFHQDRKALGLYAIYQPVRERMPKTVISMDDVARVPTAPSLDATFSLNFAYGMSTTGSSVSR